MASAGKLFKLKEWLTVADAARHLAILCDEDVTEADVLRFVMDRHLRLSVRFVNATPGRCGRLVSLDDAEVPITKLSDDPKVWLYGDVRPYGLLKTNETVVLHKESCLLCGVHDLAMIGNEVMEVERRYQELTGGPPPDRSAECFFVKTDEKSVIRLELSIDSTEFLKTLPHQITRVSFLGLPPDSYFVVRSDALREFEQSLNGAPHGQEKPITTTERNSLLTIIEALCDYSAIKTQKHGATAQIAKLTDDIGASVSPDTVGRYLKAIPNALVTRKK
jgi:hypothetical protein